ncbi:MAG: phosphatase PAP2 family protein, partial [Chitinophagaceae bacterium]
MKRIFSYLIILLAAVSVLIAACNKDVEGRTDNAPMLQPSSIDIDAGAWKPILLTGPTEFAVAAPSATTTPDY